MTVMYTTREIVSLPKAQNIEFGHFFGKGNLVLFDFKSKLYLKNSHTTLVLYVHKDGFSTVGRGGHMNTDICSTEDCTPDSKMKLDTAITLLEILLLDTSDKVFNVGWGRGAKVLIFAP